MMIDLQKLFFSLLDSIPAAVVVRDSTGVTLMANSEAHRIFENDPSIQAGASVEPSNLLLVKVDGTPFEDGQAPADRVLRGDLIRNEMIAIQFGGSRMIWGLLSSFEMDVGSESGPVTMIAFVDITEQFRAQERLGESESRASAILDSVGDGVISVNQNERIEVFNPAAQQITGYSESEAIDKHITSVFKVSLPAVTTSAEFFTAGVKQGIVTAKDGHTLRIELQISRIADQQGQRGWVYIFRDITARIRAEEERTILDKLQSVGVLAGGIAHDFNNLLASLYGNLELVGLNLNDEARARSYLKSAGESIDQARSLSNQLLTFARGNPPKLQLVDLHKLVKESAQFATSGGQFRVNFSVESGRYLCNVDPGQIQQVVNNLVLNAVQASQESQTIRLALARRESEEGGTDIVVSVSDDGQGIPEEDLGHIFEPYFTTKSSGSGLGLATTHAIVLTHGGNIQVHSTLGEGTTFEVTLPLSDETETSNLQIDETPQEHTSLHILVMDDEAPVLKTILKLLEHLGHNAVGATEGQAAVDAYQSAMSDGFEFDLVIMDLTVADGLGGREATAAILALDPSARIIVASGYSAGEELADYESHGFIARLAKPFRLDELKQALASAISQ